MNAMLKKFKYDIAISVAEEDLHVAKSIASCLKQKDISYYLYTEDIAIYWGENLFKISYDKYSGESKYVLILISDFYIKKHWSDIERQISQTVNKAGTAHILPLRLDDAPVDGLSRNTIFLKWNNNPHIEAKLRYRQRRAKRALLRLVVLTALVITLYAGSRVFVRHQRSKHIKEIKDQRDTGIAKTDTARKDSILPQPPAKKDTPVIVPEPQDTAPAPPPPPVEEPKIETDPAVNTTDILVDITGNNEEMRVALQEELLELVNDNKTTTDTVAIKASKILSIHFILEGNIDKSSPDAESPYCVYEFMLKDSAGNIVMQQSKNTTSVSQSEGTPDFKSMAGQIKEAIKIALGK
jgi:hypothetical protein